MPPKRNATDSEIEPLPIETKFVFNRPIGWTPSTSDPPANNDELKSQFAAFIQDEILAQKSKTKASTVTRANRIKLLSAIRAVALDPLSELTNLNMNMMKASSMPLEKFFRFWLDNYLAHVQSIIGIWANEPVEILDTIVEGGQADQSSTKGKREAQKKVPTWYQNCCVLTGVETVDAAHIVDVQATKSMDEPVAFWRILQMFWPLEDIQELEITGHDSETLNLLPLQPTAHRLWDRHKFALRPIPHPTQAPEHALYLQMVWFSDRHTDIGLHLNDQHTCQKSTLLADHRRLMEDSVGKGARLVMHGDVFEVTTSDPKERPLPNVYFLQMRYAMQQLFAGQQAAGALQDIFGGDPPDDSGTSTTRDEAFMPSDWDTMLSDAVELGILDTTTEPIWRRDILEKAYEQGLQKVHEYRKWKAGLVEEGDQKEEEDT